MIKLELTVEEYNEIVEGLLNNRSNIKDMILELDPYHKDSWFCNEARKQIERISKLINKISKAKEAADGN